MDLHNSSHTALGKNVTSFLNRNTDNTKNENRNKKALKSVHECKLCACLACNPHTLFFRSISYLALSVQVC